MIKLCVLGSGSTGNSTFVGTPTVRLLIDAGLSGKETARRLALIGERLESVQAVCVTHEHDDHIAGLGVLQNKYATGLYANAGTIEAIQRDPQRRALRWHVFGTGAPFPIGDLTVEPFAVSHDAFEPVGFVLATERARVGIVTDIGAGTHLVRARLRACQYLVLESNHDERLLTEADRPWQLKQRIAGRQGHLSNQAAAELVAEIAGPELKGVFLAHLSAECNQPDLAARAVRRALDARGLPSVEILLTHADTVSDVRVCP